MYYIGYQRACGFIGFRCQRTREEQLERRKLCKGRNHRRKWTLKPANKLHPDLWLARKTIHVQGDPSGLGSKTVCIRKLKELNRLCCCLLQYSVWCLSLTKLTSGGMKIYTLLRDIKEYRVSTPIISKIHYVMKNKRTWRKFNLYSREKALNNNSLHNNLDLVISRQKLYSRYYKYLQGPKERCEWVYDKSQQRNGNYKKELSGNSWVWNSWGKCN